MDDLGYSVENKRRFSVDHSQSANNMNNNCVEMITMCQSGANTTLLQVQPVPVTHQYRLHQPDVLLCLFLLFLFTCVICSCAGYLLRVAVGAPSPPSPQTGVRFLSGSTLGPQVEDALPPQTGTRCGLSQTRSWR